MHFNMMLGMAGERRHRRGYGFIPIVDRRDTIYNAMSVVSTPSPEIPPSRESRDDNAGEGGNASRRPTALKACLAPVTASTKPANGVASTSRHQPHLFRPLQRRRGGGPTRGRRATTHAADERAGLASRREEAESSA